MGESSVAGGLAATLAGFSFSLARAVSTAGLISGLTRSLGLLATDGLGVSRSGALAVVVCGLSGLGLGSLWTVFGGALASASLRSPRALSAAEMFQRFSSSWRNSLASTWPLASARRYQW